jgi:class 3 adenylate cyclase
MLFVQLVQLALLAICAFLARRVAALPLRGLVNAAGASALDLKETPLPEGGPTEVTRASTARGISMQDHGIRHRLLAILAADAVGYSRMMAADAMATLQALDAARQVFRTTIESSGGRVVDTAGDSVLAVFDTASGAVAAAMGIQTHLSSHTDKGQQDGAMLFRIGVHLGEVLEKTDGTVYGDGINVAARLQALAAPGGVVVSRAVHDAVSGHIETAFEDIGKHMAKNIAEPLRAFRWLHLATRRARRTRQRQALALQPAQRAIDRHGQARQCRGTGRRSRGRAPE